MVNTKKIYDRGFLRAIIAFSFLLSIANRAIGQEITSSHLYQMSQKTIAELNLLLKNKQVRSNQSTFYFPRAQPRHVMQKTYEILDKLQHPLAEMNIPVAHIDRKYTGIVMPRSVYANIEIIYEQVIAVKKYYNITQMIHDIELIPNKTQADVFQNMDTISLLLDALFQRNLTLSSVYTIASSINETLLGIYEHLSVKPVIAINMQKQGKRPRDVYNISLTAVRSLQSFVRENGYIIEGGISSLPPRKGHISPNDVLSVLEILLADANAVSHIIQAQTTFEIKHTDEKKTPSDVYTQLLQTNQLINGLSL